MYSCCTSSSVKTSEVKTTRLILMLSSFSICAFPPFLYIFISLKIWSKKESRLFPGSRHSGVKRKIKQSVVMNEAIFYLTYPSLFFFSLFTFVSYFITIFYLRLFQVRTVRTCSYGPVITFNTCRRWVGRHSG